MNIKQTCICRNICHKFTAFINVTDFPVKHKFTKKFYLLATFSYNYTLQNTKLDRVKACYKYKDLMMLNVNAGYDNVNKSPKILRNPNTKL